MDTILKRYGIKPDPELGQNFMTRTETIRKIVSLAEIRPGETVLEIGAGLGFLTKELARNAKRVMAVEIDRKLASATESELMNYDNVEIIRGNILKLIRRLRFDVIVSNLPYAISEALLRKMVLCDFRHAVLVVPKGFAYRLITKPGEGKISYSRLSVFAQVFFKIKMEFELSKDDFYPQPKTNSVVIQLMKKPESPAQKIFVWETKKLKNVLLKTFADYHKMTKNQAREALKSLKINDKLLEKRARDIDLKEMKTIIKCLERTEEDR